MSITLVFQLSKQLRITGRDLLWIWLNCVILKPTIVSVTVDYKRRVWIDEWVKYDSNLVYNFWSAYILPVSRHNHLMDYTEWEIAVIIWAPDFDMIKTKTLLVRLILP